MDFYMNMISNDMCRNRNFEYFVKKIIIAVLFKKVGFYRWTLIVILQNGNHTYSIIRWIRTVWHGLLSPWQVWVMTSQYCLNEIWYLLNTWNAYVLIEIWWIIYQVLFYKMKLANTRHFLRRQNKSNIHVNCM